MDELTKNIIDLEWEMFSTVNEGGEKADCQQNRPTFEIMRKSQLNAWSEELKKSWFRDLMFASARGRNLMTEKYGYMMESTDPDYFAYIKDALPAVSEEKKQLADRICRISREDHGAVADKYPHVAARGRNVTSDDDSVFNTSAETYLRGELYTYSENTLKIMAEYMENLRKNGENYAEKVLETTALSYGYKSLEDAENYLSDH